MQLNNSTAVVTGAASGLGAAVAKALAEAGASVIGLDLQKGEEVEGVRYVEVDVTDPEAVNEAVAQGESPVRVAVNCAGICPSARILGRSGVHSPDLFAKVLDVNLRGTFHVLSAAAQAMSDAEPLDDEGQRGVIINTASVAAFEGQVGQAAYAASKGAVHSLSITSARDLASRGIRVNSIAPGVVETPMMAQISEEFREELAARVQFPRRLAHPEEFARLVLSIIDNDYLNGETIRLDGALRMPPR